MSLTEYKKKRSFKKIPEPEGRKGGGNELRFVIQKHDATHLHDDFRLEMEGVLKNWAIPKGHSTALEIKPVVTVSMPLNWDEVKKGY